MLISITSPTYTLWDLSMNYSGVRTDEIHSNKMGSHSSSSRSNISSSPELWCLFMSAFCLICQIIFSRYSGWIIANWNELTVVLLCKLPFKCFEHGLWCQLESNTNAQTGRHPKQSVLHSQYHSSGTLDIMKRLNL